MPEQKSHFAAKTIVGFSTWPLNEGPKKTTDENTALFFAQEVPAWVCFSINVHFKFKEVIQVFMNDLRPVMQSLMHSDRQPSPANEPITPFYPNLVHLQGGKPDPDLLSVDIEVRSNWFLGNLRLTEFDQILVCGSWVEATDVQVGFAQQLSSTAAAAIADGGGGGDAAVVVVVGAWRSHLMVGGGHIRLLDKKENG